MTPRQEKHIFLSFWKGDSEAAKRQNWLLRKAFCKSPWDSFFGLYIGGKSNLVRIACGREPPLENRQFCEFWGENGVKCIQMGQTNFLGTINEFLGTISKIARFWKLYFKHPIKLYFCCWGFEVAKNGKLKQFPTFSISLCQQLTNWKISNTMKYSTSNILTTNKLALGFR